MRFIEHGPDIPDELLLALDEERVVFFCGAGVSQENAKLPSFMGLTKIVLAKLRVSRSEPAHKIFEHINKIKNRAHISGLIPVDRVFSALEKSNLKKREIEAIVAKALIPPKPPPPLKKFSLTAHRILLNLSTTKDKRTRLITTNFDRLFEKTRERDRAKKLTTWQRPGFPDSSQIKTFEGIVYLHGMVNENDNGSDNSFVLSSASFGEAYLNEGSATRFFKEIISEYTVVFVGYGADDPPVHYLLEALGESGKKPDNIYAFQTRTQKEVARKITKKKIAEKWQNKHVHAIVYDEEYGGNHRQLWETLRLWALRAKNLVSWQDKIIAMARKGPEKLLPFQREQVAHLVSSKEGAKRFYKSKNPPPATWLCVFDSARRFETPTTITQKDGTEIPVDYFNMYGLASDLVPKPVAYKARREAPPRSWDAFLPNAQDMRDALDYSLAPMKGTEALSVKNLPERLYAIGTWIAKVLDQNATVWWAVRQAGIHPDVQGKIKEALGRKTDCPPYIKLAWQYIFDSWSPKPDDRRDCHPKWFSFVSDVGRLGWDATMVRRYEELTKPWMVADPSFTRDEIPPQKDAKTDFAQLVSLDVSYNSHLYIIKIPDEWLAKAIKAFKRNLDEAIRLERERHYHLYLSGRTQIQADYYATMGPTIAPWDEQSLSGSPITDDLTDAVRYYTFLFKRLLEYDLPQAKAEVETWDEDDDTVYARLRMWSCQFTALVPDEEVGNFLSVISRKAFWDDDHLPDFLRTLKARWARMPDATRLAIEARILQGSERWENETQKEYTKYKAWYIFRYLVWLKDKECVLSATAEKEMVRLQKINPEYNPEHAKDVDQPRHTEAHIYFPNSDPSVFAGLAIADIMPKAEEVMRNNDYIPEHNDPFSGLCEKNPVRALAVLRREANRGEYPLWAWPSFLGKEARKKDTTRMKRFTAELIIGMPDEKAAKIINPLARWLYYISKELPHDCLSIFKKLAKRLVKITQENYKTQRIKSYHNTSMQMINTPAWYLAEALFNDPRIKELKANQSPPSDWKVLAEDMLNLPDDLGRDALMLFIRRLNWFYYVDSQWTLTNLLPPLLDKNPNTIDAWWLGYLSGVKNLLPLDLFEKIKPHLFARTSNPDAQKRNNIPMIANVILSNWSVDGEQRISNKEFYNILLDTGDNFRIQILLNIKSFCEKDINPPYWNKKRNRLLEKVWPLEGRAKTVQTSERLIDIAFANEPEFPRIAKAIIPLLGESFKHSGWSFLHGDNKDRIVDKHPEIVLEILYKVVPEDVFFLSDRVKNTLDRIATADPELTRDPRFKELQRRWAAR